MSLAARVLLAPYLAGAWINSRAWTRKAPVAGRSVADGVALGRFPDRAAIAASFAAVVDLCAELPRGTITRAGTPFRCSTSSRRRPPRCARPRRRSKGARGGPVLVCCALGYSRSAAAVATWLLVTGRAATADDAIERVRRVRPRIVLETTRGARSRRLPRGQAMSNGAADAMLAAVAAALLDQGRIDRPPVAAAYCRGAARLLIAGECVRCRIAASCGGCSRWRSLAGLAETYLAIRVGFDAALFRRLGEHSGRPISRALDAALTRLGLLPAARAGRPLELRIAGAQRLFYSRSLRWSSR